MKNLYKSFTLFCLMFILSVCSYAQVNSPWKWSHPKPQGNTLRYVKAFSTTNWVAIGYAGTFMKTTNGGANWFITHDAAGVRTNTQIFFYSGWFFNMNSGFACGSSGNLWRTTNGGINWDSVGVPSTGTLYGIHFINSTTGFIGGTSSTALKTTDVGANWVSMTPPTYTYYNIYALDTNYIYLPSSSANLIYTTNGGTNWTTVSTGTSVTLYDVAFRNSNTGFVCGTSTALRLTTNGGANWTQTSTGLPSSTFYELTYFSTMSSLGTDYLFASGNPYYIFRSLNNGQTWDSISFNGNQYYTSTYYSLDVNANTMITGGAYGLLNTSTNSGTNWIAHNYFGYSGTFNDIWANMMNGTVIAVGTAGPVPIIYSSNGGATWDFTVSTNIGSGSAYGISMVNSSTGYVSGSSSMMYKTTNGGLNWDSTTIGTSTTLYKPDFVNANTGFVCGSSGRVFKTTNAGANWTLLTTGTTSTLNWMDFTDANTGWIVGTSGLVRKTTDGGATWTAQTPSTTSSLYGVDMINANSGYICGLSGTVRRTTNGGTNWDTVATPFTQSQYGMSFSDMNNGFVVGSSGYTIRTSNGGTNWQVLNNSGSTQYEVYAKGYDSAWVCGSGANIFKLYDYMVGGITWNNEIPMQYILYQNYPNPFNPTTTIKFGLPKAGKVMLKIYDITGREVQSLFNNIEMNPGTVAHEFDGTNLASGIYFYSLIVNNNLIDSRKMILIK